MDINQIAGLAVVLICSLGYYLAWKYKRKDQYLMAILLLMVCGFILRLYTAADFFLHEWDERYHALVAKNLIKHPFLPTLYDNPLLPYNYQHWASNHIWVHKQPLPLWTMAGSMYLFGVNEIALRLPSILLTTIGIYLIYCIASFLFNNKVGFLAAFLYSINGLIK